MPRILGLFHHLFHLDLLHIEWIIMREPRLRVIELESKLVKFKASVRSLGPAALAQCIHLLRAHRRKALRHAKILQ